MPAEQHKKAKESFTKAADAHGKAETEYKAGNHEKGAHYAQAAKGHKEDGKDASREASKKHAEKYGNK